MTRTKPLVPLKEHPSVRGLFLPDPGSDAGLLREHGCGVIGRDAVVVVGGRGQHSHHGL